MENLKKQIQEEVKGISHCTLIDIDDLAKRQLKSKREGSICIFKYSIPCGSLKGQKITIGIELPPNDYPRLPPHFIQLRKNDFNEELLRKMGTIHEEYLHKEEQWLVLSRPPQDIWDNLGDSQQNLHTFFESHLRRFWKDL